VKSALEIRRGILFGLLAIVVVVLFAFDLASGSVGVGGREVWALLTGGPCDPMARDIILKIRLIKAVVAVLAGVFVGATRPLRESRMMRDILLEIGQRGNEALDPQSVPLAMRRRAPPLASESGLSGLKQCAVDELHLNEAGITLVCKGEHTAFLYADYNYENIEDTDCLPAVAEYLVQHMRGYYNITRSFYSVPKANGHVEEKTREVTVVRHHEDTPFAPGPVQKQHLF